MNTLSLPYFLENKLNIHVKFGTNMKSSITINISKQLFSIILKICALKTFYLSTNTTTILISNDSAEKCKMSLFPPDNRNKATGDFFL